MKKKIVGIDLNEVIRGRWQKFDQCYIQEFGEDGIHEPFNTYDFRNHYDFTDSIESIEVLNENMIDTDEFKNVSPIEYIVDEKTGKAPIDAIAMKKENTFIKADDVYKKFLYETYGFEIFAAAPPLYKGVDLDIQKFFKYYKDQIDLRIISKDNVLSIPFTLSFLSRVRTRFSSYHFSEKNEELWSYVDILITTDPELVATKPEGKQVIKLTRGWNLGQPCDFEKINVIDLLHNTEFEKMVGFEVPSAEIIEEEKQEKL